MIWESGPWKDELLANVRLLKKLEPSRRTARREFAIERAVFFSAYIMRKLWEAGKLSSTWKTKRSKCIYHRPKGRFVDRLNWHRIDELFDLNRPEDASLTAIELCNRLIHSFVFLMVDGPRKTIAGFFFTSDQTRRRGLWFIEFAEILALMRETGRDYPSSGRMVRHPRTCDWIAWAGHGVPPEEWTKAAEHLQRLSVHSTNAKSGD
jgi:hypothetical protein